MYMLDTNAVIYSIRHPYSECAGRIADNLGGNICISVVTYAELDYGVRKSRYPEQNRQALEKYLSSIEILDFDLKAAEHFGDILNIVSQMEKTSSGGDRDRMIAGHARSAGCILITDNIKDFNYIPGLEIEDWIR